MVEQMLRDLCAAEPAFGAVTLRYFNPIGAHPSGQIGESPRDVPNNLFPYITQVAVGRQPFLNVFGDDYATEDGTGVRDYLHVMDLAQGHVQALAYAADHAGFVAVNLGTGQGTSVLELVRAFERVSQRRIPLRKAPRRAGDIERMWADPALAASLLAGAAPAGSRPCAPMAGAGSRAIRTATRASRPRHNPNGVSDGFREAGRAVTVDGNIAKQHRRAARPSRAMHRHRGTVMLDSLPSAGPAGILPGLFQ